MLEDKNKTQCLRLIVDLDERGTFKAHVEDENGTTVFSYSNENEDDIPDPDGLWLVYDGFMKHSCDTDGLLDYLRHLGLASNSAIMLLEQ